MQTAEQRWPELFALVAKDHEGLEEGHDIHHVTRVAHYGRIIYEAEWPDDERGTHITEYACLFHNADRILEKRLGAANVTPTLIEELVNGWLALYVIPDHDLEVILNAVLTHNGKNDPNHSKVAKALRDADRVVNLELDVIPRSAQRFHDKPVMDYQCFFQTPPNFRDPKTVMEDLALSLEWVDPTHPCCLQTGTGMKLGLERARLLHMYFDLLKTQMKAYGYFKK